MTTTTILRGYDGKVQQGATGAEVDFAFIEEWEADLGVDLDKNGPFLNDGGKEYKSRGAQHCKGKIKGVVPGGKDASQTAVIAALTGGTDMRLVLIQGVTGSMGYTVTIPAAVISAVKLGQGGKNGAAFEASFEDNGGYTVT